MFGIVTRTDGLKVWNLEFETLRSAKLSVMHNRFNSAAVGVAEVANGKAIGDIFVRNPDSGVWEAVVDDKTQYAFRNAKASLEIEGHTLLQGSEELILSEASGEISEEEFFKRALEIVVADERK